MDYENTLAPAHGGCAQQPLLCLSDERVAVILPRPPHTSARRETIAALTRHAVPGYHVEALEIGAARDALSAGRHRLALVWTSDPDAGEAISRAQDAGALVCAIHDPGAAGPAAADSAGRLERCRIVLSPTRAADRRLAELGVEATAIARWRPGIDRERFSPAYYSASAIEATPGAAHPAFSILAAEPIAAGPELTLLMEAFERACRRDDRPQLVMVGRGPAERDLRARLGGRLVVVDPAQTDRLAPMFASAELFVSVGAGDSYGVLQAQASGVAALATEGSGAAEAIEPGRNGCVVAPDPDALGAAIHGLARRATLRERLAAGGLQAAAGCTWERALAELSVHWDAAVRPRAAEVPRAA